ncbi:MAG: NAD-dependent epimerase/dehydratase family protein [Candidatus Omnitrophica bacterium]|nr:NAD-dependent epimerase/dehydratase family protein [Candidatus Omnitrophota bacterium]
MRVLVTGGAGFIGSHVVDRLVAHGVVPLIFDQQRSTYHPSVEHCIGSILDVEALRVAMFGVQAIIHLAAVADVKDVFEDPSYAEMVNTRGTACVLEAVRRSKVMRIVYGSTTWVYSDVPQQEVDEDTPLAAPSHLYTATKIASEYYCQAYAKLYGIEYTILRFGIPYGPRARDGAVIPIFVNKALQGEPLTIAGDGSQFRKFVYVEDLAEGNALALAPAAKNRIYNLDGAEPVTIKQIAETVQRVLGGARIEYVAARPGDFSGKRVLSARAKQELGWEPTTPFEEGVRRYVQWVKHRKDQRDAEEARLDPALR